MSWKDAEEIADGLGWTKTQSWEQGGGYGTTRPSEKVKKAIKRHKMESGKWRRLLHSA